MTCCECNYHFCQTLLDGNYPEIAIVNFSLPQINTYSCHRDWWLELKYRLLF